MLHVMISNPQGKSQLSGGVVIAELPLADQAPELQNHLVYRLLGSFVIAAVTKYDIMTAPRKLFRFSGVEENS